MSNRIAILTKTLVIPIALIFFAICSYSEAAEVVGWELSWSSSAQGGGSIEWQSGIEPNIETYKEHRSYSASFGGSYITDVDGYIISGSSSGFNSDSYGFEHLDWLCGFGDILQYVSSKTNGLTSEILSGPSVGDRFSVYESIDSITGSPYVFFSVYPICTGEYSYSSQSYDVNYCTEQNDSGSWPTSGCSSPSYYMAWDILEAKDDTNITFSSSGSNIIWIWSVYSHPVGYTGALPAGPIVQTWSGQAKKIVLPTIHGIEFTQATQVYQPLDEFLKYLQNNNLNPPVPIVAYKPLAIRVVLDKESSEISGIIEVYWNGNKLGEDHITQSSTCEPPPDPSDPAIVFSSRENVAPDCRTADFFVPLPEEGENNVKVIVRSDVPELFKEHKFIIRAKKSDTVVVGAVNVCADRIAGRWDCVATPVGDLQKGVSLMREIYPTDTVVVEPTGHQIHLEIVDGALVDTEPGDVDEADCYDRFGNKIFDGHYNALGNLVVDAWSPPTPPIISCEKDMWWDLAALRINRLYAVTERTLEWLGGIQWYFYGLVKHNNLFCDPLGCTMGMAYDIPARGALGITEGAGYDERDVKETVAHEIGHLFGRYHTNKKTDIDPNCSYAEDPGTDYPLLYPDSKLYSGDPIPISGLLKQEVGYHVRRKSIRKPYLYYDVMSYCSPNWITPFTYTKLLEIIDPPPPPPPGETGNYWLISGFVDETTAYLEPILSFNTIGPVETGSGTHRIEVLDVSEEVLFTRYFTPSIAQTLRSGESKSLIGLPSFAELIPINTLAAKIIIRNDEQKIIGEQLIKGIAPVVNLLFPIGGEQIDGEQNISWTASDSDTAPDNIVYWIQYSADGGNKWLTLGQNISENSLKVNFDELPGSSNGALIKVLASDGVNTGTDTSESFSVSKKLPTVEITLPDDNQILPADKPNFFEGYGYDLDDGVLPGDAHIWSSNIDGEIGAGYEIVLSDLSKGRHNITLTVTDSDNNVSSDTLTIVFGEIKTKAMPWIPLLLLED
jgi:hypothetical protein